MFSSTQPLQTMSTLVEPQRVNADCLTAGGSATARTMRSPTDVQTSHDDILRTVSARCMGKRSANSGRGL